MTHNTRIATLLAGVLVLALGGCLREPTIELTGVRVGGIGFRGATLLAELHIDNPNRFALETDSITFTMDASDAAQPNTWTQVTTGTHTQRFRVQKQGTATAEIPIEFEYSRLATPLRSIVESGRFNYRLSGTVFVRRPLPRRVRFGDEGSLALFGTSR